MEPNLNYARWRITIRTGPDLNFCLSMAPNAPSTARRSVPRCRRRPGRCRVASAPATPPWLGCYPKDSSPSSARAAHNQARFAGCGARTRCPRNARAVQHTSGANPERPAPSGRDRQQRQSERSVAKLATLTSPRISIFAVRPAIKQE